jgi:hypothetical protein
VKTWPRRERSGPDTVLNPKFAHNEVVRISLYSAAGKFKNELAQKARRYFADIGLVESCSIYERSGWPVLVYRVKAEDGAIIELTEDCLMALETTSRSKATASAPGDGAPGRDSSGRDSPGGESPALDPPAGQSSSKESQENKHAASLSAPGNDKANAKADAGLLGDPATSVPAEPPDAARFIPETVVAKAFQDEIASAARDLVEEQRKSIKLEVELHKAVLREVVDEHRALTQSRIDEFRRLIARLGTVSPEQ